MHHLEMADHITCRRNFNAVVSHCAKGGDFESGGVRADPDLNYIAGCVQLAEDVADVL